MNVNRGLKCVLVLASMLLSVSPVVAAELIIDVGSMKKLTTEQLLSRPDVATIVVPGDVTYHRTMTYRAVPLRALPGVKDLSEDAELQITATDGFVTDLPARLVLDDSGKGAVPWLAIEPSDKPWPRSPGGAAVGPFYVVWLKPAASGVMSEQWPFNVDSMRAVPVRATRWPQLAVDANVPADSPIRRGQILVATQCMVCHRMNGAGDASVGPDLNRPHNPTEYLQPWALKALIRDPRSVRVWPDMKMTGFDQAAISDADLDAIIAYLGYMTTRRN
ncbi:mono/diheme cytochrome c family protein [Paraburkholderia sp. BL8N3]|nr:cytochrome c [Paraburkholderia sp. BL8N3]TCK36350.1 mono/diheme cytochrome c family protein [Paraburkholderia sp. BL8N3]